MKNLHVARVQNFFLILIYLFYRVCNDIIERISIFFAKSLPSGQCDIMRILWRNKYAEGDVSSHKDFLGIYAKRASIEEIRQNPTIWSLYAFTQDQVYFVELPLPFSEYSATKRPFLQIAQFQDAIRMARISLNDFIEYFGSDKTDVTNRLVMITMVPRSGSTLLTQMLDVEGEGIGFSEPDSFSLLAMQDEEGLWDSRTVDAVINASIRCLIRSANRPGKTVTMKLNSYGTRLASRIRRLFPEAVIIHTYRGFYKCLLSNDKYMRHTNFTIELLALWKMFGRKFTTWLTPNGRVFADLVEQHNARSCWEFSFMQTMTPQQQYLVHEKAYSMPNILFENLVSDEGGIILQQIYELCGWPVEKAIQIAKSRLGQDSQKDSLYSREAQAQFPYSKMAEKDRETLKQLGKNLGILCDWI